MRWYERGREWCGDSDANTGPEDAPPGYDPDMPDETWTDEDTRESLERTAAASEGPLYPGRRGVVCSVGDGCVFVDVGDEEPVKVGVTHEIARDVQLYSEVTLPDGDITRPEVASGIRWTF